MGHDRSSIVNCPKCKGRTFVVDSRGAPDNGVRRRREYALCYERFTTYERIVEKVGFDSKRQARELVEQLAEMLGVRKVR